MLVAVDGVKMAQRQAAQRMACWFLGRDLQVAQASGAYKALQRPSKRVAAVKVVQTLAGLLDLAVECGGRQVGYRHSMATCW